MSENPSLKLWTSDRPVTVLLGISSLCIIIHFICIIYITIIHFICIIYITIIHFICIIYITIIYYMYNIYYYNILYGYILL